MGIARAVHAKTLLKRPPGAPRHPSFARRGGRRIQTFKTKASALVGLGGRSTRCAALVAFAANLAGGTSHSAAACHVLISASAAAALLRPFVAAREGGILAVAAG